MRYVKIIRRKHLSSTYALRCIKNRTLSWPAKGLFAYLWIMPLNTSIEVNELASKVYTNEVEVMTLLNELVANRCLMQFMYDSKEIEGVKIEYILIKG